MTKYTSCRGCGGSIGRFHSGACDIFPFGGIIDQDEIDQSYYEKPKRGKPQPTIPELCRQRDAIQNQIDEMMKLPLHIRRKGYE